MNNFEWFYIQYLRQQGLTLKDTPTKDQEKAAGEYAVKMCQKEYMRHDREIGVVGISFCVLLMLFFIARFICAINGISMR